MEHLNEVRAKVKERARSQRQAPGRLRPDPHAGIFSGTGRFANRGQGSGLPYISATWARFPGNVTFVGGPVPW
jgi:hypothetical protein